MVWNVPCEDWTHQKHRRAACSTGVTVALLGQKIPQPRIVYIGKYRHYDRELSRTLLGRDCLMKKLGQLQKTDWKIWHWSESFPKNKSNQRNPSDDTTDAVAVNCVCRWYELPWICSYLSSVLRLFLLQGHVVGWLLYCKSLDPSPRFHSFPPLNWC